jgi:hypothetical protein
MTTSAPLCRRDHGVRCEPACGQGDEHAGVVPVGSHDDPLRVRHGRLPEHLLAAGVTQHADAAVRRGRLDVGAVGVHHHDVVGRVTLFDQR